MCPKYALGDRQPSIAGVCIPGRTLSQACDQHICASPHQIPVQMRRCRYQIPDWSRSPHNNFSKGDLEYQEMIDILVAETDHGSQHRRSQCRAWRLERFEPVPRIPLASFPSPSRRQRDPHNQLVQPVSSHELYQHCLDLRSSRVGSAGW